MKPVRIALFTPFSPTIGGGSTIFRSLIPHLAGAEVRWFYLAGSKVDFPNSTYLGPSALGGSFVADALNSAKLYILQRFQPVETYVRAIQEWTPDIVWVNAMNEGLLVGKLCLDAAYKLHVSVHDDPRGLAIKSRRYRHLAHFIDKCNCLLLKRANTSDVVSEAMRFYYKDRYGVNSGVVYRYIAEPTFAVAKPATGSTILVGHVGSAYSMPEVAAFLGALRKIEETDGVRFKVLTFGKPPFSKIAGGFPGLVENCGDVSEREAVERLQQCAFVYSMYSFNRRHRIFRETSQPTKMSTYLMAARPIFAHCPQGSSMIDFVTRFKVGTCVTSLDQDALVEGIRSILKFNLEFAEVQRAIEHYCGRRNLAYLEDCFGLNQAGLDMAM